MLADALDGDDDAVAAVVPRCAKQRQATKALGAQWVWTPLSATWYVPLAQWSGTPDHSRPGNTDDIKHPSVRACAKPSDHPL